MVVLVVFARRRERIARLLPFKQARWRGVLWLLSIARGLNPYLRSIAMESEELLKAAMWRGVWWVICSGGKLAGENLGFLPGDLSQKIDPYLRPMYDALNTMMDTNLLDKMIDQNIIEVAPLAYMRGRTLDNAFIILDEAQNSTKEQMKMFLTRLGKHSKAVITGDITQIDLPNAFSGLVHVLPLIDKIPGISVCKFTDEDVMRHPLVKKIIKAYEKKVND